MLIPKNILASVASAAYPGDDRLQINGVYLERDKDGTPHATATTGKILVSVAWCEEAEEDYPGAIPGLEEGAMERVPGKARILSRADAMTLAKAAPAKPFRPVFGNIAIEEKHNDTMATVVGDLGAMSVRIVRPVDGTYPDYGCVFREDQRPVVSLKVDPVLLMDALKALTTATGKGCRVATLDIYSGEKPMVFTAQDPEKTREVKAAVCLVVGGEK